jgi:putative ATP-dependent endonuclease of OLD family
VKVTRVEVQNYRSFPDPFTIDLADGMNVFVGRNNCGKSNLFSALTLAMLPEALFDPARDAPSQRTRALPRIAVEFQAHAQNAPEKTLLRYAQRYEESLGVAPARTYAAKGVLRFVVEHRNGLRQEFFQAAGKGARRPAADDDDLLRLLTQFRRTTRFVFVKSGESLEGLLQGPFREILHLVLREHLQEELSAAEANRSDYVKQLQDGLLAPLQGRVGDVVGAVFPEITGAVLEPQLPTVEQTLADMRISLTDAAVTDLLQKGTGVRGGVLLALLRYLAEQSRRSVIFAVEEPEAFLHPAAQEDLRDQLEALATRDDVSLLVTTHSPFIVSRNSHSKVFALAKDLEGRTKLKGSVPGNQTQASAMSDLFRDPGLADILDEALTVDLSGCQGVLVVEGATDHAYLSVAARLTDRLHLLDRLKVVVAEGASKAVVKAMVLSQRTTQPVLVLLDGDEIGGRAGQRLDELLHWNKKREVLSLAGRAHAAKLDAVEAEDLWPPALMQRFVDHFGDSVLAEKRRIPKSDEFRIGLTAEGKGLIGDWVGRYATVEDCSAWIVVLDELARRLDALLQDQEKRRIRETAVTDGAAVGNS